MNQLFVSDLHLTSPETTIFQSFRRLIERSTKHRPEIYIIGDLSEAWVGDDDNSDLSLALTDLFQFARQRPPIYILPSIIDFLPAAQFANKTEITLLNLQYMLTS